ncbi:MAG: tripartite tricarboxylate transporter TctB family protein [Gemmobacter sp.]|uniref:tripartite tricarboxylate transporter TctB family protein n=1 Tax=Gemmobacter sp. TaxID=1898957 RepID=UPI00391BC9E8
MIRGDRILGAVLMVLALGYLLSAATIQTSFISDPVGPRIFPYIIGSVVLLCALFLVVKPDPEVEWPGPGMALKMLLALVVLVAYAQTVRPLGFILPTIVASGVLSYLISPRAVPAALAGLGLGLGLYGLFKLVLGLGLHPWPNAFGG